MASFKPIPGFTVPFIHLKVRDWQNKYEKIYELASNTNLTASENPNTDHYIPTDFRSEDWANRQPQLCASISSILKEEIETMSIEYHRYINEYFFSNQGKDYDSSEDQLNIISSWFELANAFHWHEPHDHGSVELACILYINFDPNVHTPVQLISPMSIASMQSVSIFQPQETVNSGDIIAFPGNILHYTKPNASAIPRLILGMNLMRSSRLYTQQFEQFIAFQK